MSVEFGFWLCLLLLWYTYLGYPLAVFLLARIAPRSIAKKDFAPTVTVLIAAFNEEQEIERTVVNKLAQDYPIERLDVIVISDGSTDRTDAIVRELQQTAGHRLQLLRQEPRQGKTQALNMAFESATGEILVFADANSMYASDAIRRLVRNFADPGVGYVTGRLTYLTPDGSRVGEGAGVYMRYENLLRALETQIGSIVGVDGGIDAVRRKLYVPMRADQLPDFVLPLTVAEQRKRVVYEPSALLCELALGSAKDELRMRVRVCLRALWALHEKRNLLNPIRYPLLAWQLFSHKALRYAAFVPLLGLLVTNGLLIDEHPFYRAFLTVQLLAYALAASGHLLSKSTRRAGTLLAPYYFVILNLACALAFWKFLRRQRMVTWTPRAGN